MASDEKKVSRPSQHSSNWSLHEESTEATCRCCDKQAVAVWVSDSVPEHKWALCKGCHDEGSWKTQMEQMSEKCDSAVDAVLSSTEDEKDSTAARIEPIQDAPFESIAEKTNTSSTKEEGHPVTQDENSPTQSTVASDAESSDSETEPKTQEHDTVEQQVETWALKEISSITAVSKKKSLLCGTEGCGLTAACTYVSSLPPHEKWSTCLDCQLLDYGGWPSLSELPITSMSIKHKEALVKHCSKDPHCAMPVFPADSKPCDRLVASKQSPPASGGFTQSKKEEATPKRAVDEEPAVETWALKHISSIEAVTKKKSALCATDGCGLAAACIYVSSLPPHEKWPTCLDCQLLDYGGWPSLDEMPIVSMSDKHKAALLKFCSKNPNCVMPVFPTDPRDGKSSTGSIKEPPVADPGASSKAKKAPEVTPKHNAEEEVEEVEIWALTEITSVEAVTKTQPTLCATEGCDLLAACTYVSSLPPHEKWPTCLDCQLLDYGGWPGVDELPITSMSDEHKAALVKHCSKDPNCVMPTEFPKSVPDSSGASEVDDGEEKWEITRIMSIKDVNDFPIKCSHDHCMLPAACIYVSNKAPTTKWYSCLDCQTTDFGGWPDTVSELPLKYMSEESKAVLVSKCSKKSSVPMPTFPAASPGKNPGEDSSLTLFTPPPHSNNSQTAGKKKKKGDGKNVVTPHPGSTKSAKQPSKKALEIHRKWQAEAEKLGGPGTRIEVSKPAAKKLIFDYLFDSFRPKNITEIFTGLKGVVPQPILKSSLDDMCSSGSENPFADSDDEDEKKGGGTKKKSSNDPFAGSLVLKSGRGANSSLYYVDYNMAKNGNGLDPEERNELASAVATTQAEESALLASIKAMNLNAKQLESEPKNDELAVQLDQGEAFLFKLQSEVEEARKLKVNENHKKQVKRRCENMTTQWRKRRRLCMDFLISMEECTEGTISVKKTLTGDGQIEIDSDENVAKFAVEFGKKKRANPKRFQKRVLGVKKQKTATEAGIPPSEDFVAVLFDSQLRVRRVHLDDDDMLK